ncbi:MAG: phospholipase D-like domain-containing protein [Thermoplasmata archaeon]
MLFIEPEDRIDPIIDFIRKSRKFLYINCYLIDSKDVISEIAKASKRNIDVKIIVDGRPYENGNAKVEIADLKKTGASVKIAPSRFEEPDVFDHAKYMVSKKMFEIGTPNLTDAGFTRNREYFIISRDRAILKEVVKLFESDWNNKQFGKRPQNLIISPGSEDSIAKLIKQAGNIFIETEEMGDDAVLLKIMSEKGKKLKIILPSSISGGDLKNVDLLKKNGVSVKFMPASDLYMHAKMISGKREAFIGSENFSTSSLNKNRELGIIIKRWPDKRKLRKTFLADWKIASKNIKQK